MGAATCWYCRREPDQNEIEWGAVLRPRSARGGGPVFLLTCRGCGTPNVVEHNGAGETLLSPPEAVGYAPPGLDEDVRYAARRWIARNRHLREEFLLRTAAPSGKTSGPADLPAASPAPPRVRREAPPPEEPAVPPGDRREGIPAGATEAASLIAAYEVLDLPLNATPGEIRNRYRELAKTCHPDRVAGLDPEIRRLAERKFRALRRAYELITGDG